MVVIMYDRVFLLKQIGLGVGNIYHVLFLLLKGLAAGDKAQDGYWSITYETFLEWTGKVIEEKKSWFALLVSGSSLR